MIPKGSPPNEEEKQRVFGSRKVFLLLLLYRVVGICNTLILPQKALTKGALGHLISYLICCVALGIPAMYMELIISQFTGRDCIDMWKIRPCLAHFGYFVQFWQVIVFLYNHSIVSLLLHYFIISFESPPMYSRCGDWSNKMCNIIKYNQTANARCVRASTATQECEDLFISYPEYQYYVYNLFEGKRHEFFIAWPICLSSAIVIVMVFINCFRRIISIKWLMYPMSLYPLITYLVLLMGSMRQKGLILFFAEAMDFEFIDFRSRFRVGALIMHTMYSVGVGSGIISNMAALAPFRSPCLSTAVTAVLTSAIFTAVAIVTSAMMVCPYAFEYGGNTDLIVDHPVSFAFVKLPRLLSEYYNKSAWLLLTYSCQCILGINSNVIIFYTSLETAARRYPMIGKYSALCTFIVMLLTYIFTIPTLGTVGKDIISVYFRNCVFLVTTFFAMVEALVFMIWYGLDKFYEDIHFMQGIQPKTYMKVSWMMLCVVLIYATCSELINLIDVPKTSQEFLVYVFIILMIALPIVILIFKLVVAAFQKKFMHQLKLDPKWGPQDEILRRSRAMFTAHAMTKEYMYRQYHLQAGIMARKQLSNTRDLNQITIDHHLY